MKPSLWVVGLCALLGACGSEAQRPAEPPTRDRVRDCGNVVCGPPIDVWCCDQRDIADASGHTSTSVASGASRLPASSAAK